MALGVGLGALENHIGDTAQQRKVPTDDAAFLTTSFAAQYGLG